MAAEKITTPSQGLFPVVSRHRQARRAGRELRRARLHGHQAARLRHLGEDAAGPRPHVQGHRPRQRLLPAVHPQDRSSPRKRRWPRASPRSAPSSRTTGSRPIPGKGLDRRSRGEARRAADHPADLRDDHLEHLQELDSELPRPAAAHQPVVQRRALGDAHAAVPAHGRVPLAGRPHRPRHAAGGRGGDAADARGLPHASPRSGWRCRCWSGPRARARSSPAPSTRSASRR